MDIANNFFKTFYNDSNLPLDSNTLDIESLQNLTLDEKSIILSVNMDNFDLYTKTKSFKAIFNSCFKDTPCNIECIKLAQSHILSSLNSSDFHALKPYIFRLNAAEILNNAEARSFIQFLNASISSMRKDMKAQSKQLNLQTLSTELESIHKKLLELNLNPHTYTSLSQILNNMKNQRFSIGITGVLSAGKSTFLNALLGKEVLGSSTVPETANLTLLKHGEREYARVHFWNLKEWQELKEAAAYNESLLEFINQSENIFKDNLSKYISDKGETKDIELSELSTFTSANHESKFCNLVKEIELFTQLKFLRNNVEIVDTPGLDDPVVKREEITKAYISNCDLLIHVMNASCVATQVDIDFILESLVEQNISRLLVVLTRADLIGEKELNQSLEYTKSSLSMQLKKSKYSGDIESLLSRIEFIPIASFLALLHRTNREKEALDKGYTLEKTGILEIEAYLDSMLLGENSLKHKDILYIAYRGFLKQVLKAKDELLLELKILNASKEELESLLDSLKAENNALLESSNKQIAELNKKHEELNDFFSMQGNMIDKALKIEQERLKSRIYDDAIYGYDNNKVPSKESICEVLEIAIRDCFVDTARDYKQKTMQKIAQILSSLSGLDSKIDEIKQPKITFNITKEQTAQSLKILESSIPNLVASHSKNSAHELSVKLDSVLKEGFGIAYNQICAKSSEISSLFLEYFDEVSKYLQRLIQDEIKEKDVLLNQMLEKKAKADSKEVKEAMAKKQKELESIASELLYIANELG